ncbi:type I secretion system membrane fusion protein PrsE [mine drainage metagenome]|uniref:Type I secretion system membrane fusion protein PrsE n=1 Tax=mine drainage metagenome TaxID=410659 RepID=A0A1J5R7L2_9ZZZZ
MTRPRDLIDRYPLPDWRPVGRVVMALLALLFLWACFAQLDEVATASGDVVPEGKVKLIQNLEGGIVRDIAVHDGQRVKKGQTLLLLELPSAVGNKDDLQVRIDGLELTRARLLAEASDKPLSFPAAEAKRQPALVEAERRSHEALLQNLQTSLMVLQDQQKQRQLEVRELEAKQRSVNSSLALSREKLAMSTSLLKDGLTSKIEHVQTQNDVEALNGQAQALQSSVPRAEAALAEAVSRIAEEKVKFRQTAESQLTETELNLARSRQMMNQASDQQRRANITSPIDGIVKNLRENTIGGVVGPGAPIMEIVPVNERLNIEAKLSPADRGYVTVGQKAEVKISAYDYTIYGGLDGKVIMVAADTTTGPDNQPYYRVIIETGKSALGDHGELPITPGMQAQVDIHTGRHSVLHYLLTPVLKLRDDAFHER